MPTEELLRSLQELSAQELENLLRRRRVEDAALNVLWPAARVREREQLRQQRRESARGR